jgi:hypothetical protein
MPDHATRSEERIEPGRPLGPERRDVVPPPQQPYEQALQLGLQALADRSLSETDLHALGAALDAGRIRLPVLQRHLLIDLDARAVWVEGAGRARTTWAVLAVHYLCAGPVAPDEREVSFSQFADCRSYVSVFGKRIVGRFLATAGRTAEQFGELSARVGAERLPGPGARYRFALLPHVPIVIVRYEGDDEVGPGATVLYRADIEQRLPAEDRVVAAELLLDALSGKPMSVSGGAP